MSGGRRYSPARFRELAMLCLSEARTKGGPDPRRLWETMFRIDMEAYRTVGKSITGTTWVKTENGVRPRFKSERP